MDYSPVPAALSRQTYAPADPLLSAAEAAAETGRGVSTFRRDVKSGVLPPPCVRIGRVARWRRSALLRALGLAA